MGVKHEVLNAKNHEREAYIIAQAGRYGGVTVSTNMAGRGTDILLGGNPEFLTQEDVLKQKLVESIHESQAPLVADRQFYYFQRGDMHYRVPADKWQPIYAKYKEQCEVEHKRVVEAGGLCIVGTERHESRRIDNQLRGRAGRQGDPGSSRFFLSLQDDLLRVFGGDRIQGLMLRLGMEEDVPIESKLITRRIAKAQETVEAQNFASRKHVKEYDDVMDKQRKAVYGLRRQLLEGADMKDRIFEIVDGILASFIDLHCPEGTDPYKWDLLALQTDINSQFGLKIVSAGRSRQPLPQRDGRGHPGETQEALRRKGRNRQLRSHARDRAHDLALRHRPAVERPPALDGPPQGRHRHAGLRPEGPAH